MKVCRLKRPMLIYGMMIPTDHWMRVIAERELAVEFAILTDDNRKGVATLLKTALVFSHKEGVVPMQAPATEVPATARARAASRKQKAIDIANSAARIMEESKAKREAGEATKAESKAKVKSTKVAVANGELIPLKKICADLDIEPRIARRLLRDAKVDRPDGRWEWSKDDAKVVSDRIKELAKAAK